MSKTVLPVHTGDDGPLLQPRTALVRVQLWNTGAEEREFGVGKYTIGRDSGDIVLFGDRSVSRCHAQLEVAPGRVTITDLGSTNGTFDRHGWRVHGAHDIGPNETIRIGQNSLTVLRVVPTLAGTSGTLVSTGSTQPAIPAALSRESLPTLDGSQADSSQQGFSQPQGAQAGSPPADNSLPGGGANAQSSRPAPPRSGPFGKR